jgi:hypothetical protein
MITLIISLLIAALVGAPLGVFKISNYTEKDKDGDNTGEPNFNQLVKTTFVVLLAIVIWAFLPLGIQRIDSGNIGLKVDRIGNEKGIPVARPCKGLVFYNTWTTDVEEVSIRQFPIKYNEFEFKT